MPSLSSLRCATREHASLLTGHLAASQQKTQGRGGAQRMLYLIVTSLAGAFDCAAGAAASAMRCLARGLHGAERPSPHRFLPAGRRPLPRRSCRCPHCSRI